MLPHVNYDLMIKARLNQAHELTINISKPGVVTDGVIHVLHMARSSSLCVETTAGGRVQGGLRLHCFLWIVCWGDVCGFNDNKVNGGIVGMMLSTD